ncbi:SMI1/KNR4 family protein [Streptomyces sp. RerS4]|uniref:SMI1/KNR4 family protein n=1 Tax=Streptomyces sp. RerS4 TaxID=2942449 RepID=UPI00201C2DF9|nr:SMI1/KNR4 family protein [Streptomyces sp. RerS4]UQW99449.1 SMI1/KNR4 family protein [Streptomyces sp. RerS4]
MARFDEVKTAFWSDGDEGVQPPLTEEAVREAEHVLGVTLPAALLELLRVRNGGLVDDGLDAFPTGQATSWSEDHVPFEGLMGIGRCGRTISLLDTPYLLDEWKLPSPIVLLSGDGHCWIGLDYRRCGPTGEPAVTWFDAETGAELKLAGDFTAFIEGLTPSSAFADNEGASTPAR